MRVPALASVLLVALARPLAAGDAEPSPGFAAAVAAAAEGRALPEVALDEASVERLRGRAGDRAAPERERAVALAFLGSVAPEPAQRLVERILREARERRAASRMHWVPPPDRFLEGEALAPEHVAPLAWRALGAREFLAVSALGWIPGEEARLVTLAFEPGVEEPGDDPRLPSLLLRAARGPEERAALVAWARGRPPEDADRAVVLIALAAHGDAGIAEAVLATLEAAAAAPRPPGPGGRALARALAGERPPGFPAAPAGVPVRACGPALARIVERWPDLLPELERALAVCEAPVPKALLWSRLGGRSHAADAAVVRILRPRLDAADEAPLLAALGEDVRNAPYYYLRLALVIEGPASLLTPAVHGALWRVAESVGRAEGLGGPGVAATQAVVAIERFRDPRDTARLDRLVGVGAIDASTEALREVLRRAGDPTARFLGVLVDPEAGRREAAHNALVVDFSSSPALPIPRTLATWRRIAGTLEREILETGDLGPRHLRLQALVAVTVPGPLSPMRDRTPEDDLALVGFVRRLLAEHAPDAPARTTAVSLLGWSRRPEALPLLQALSEDPDPAVARAARAALEGK